MTTSPGSPAEQLLQCAYGTEDRAARFYTDQMRDRLLPRMVEFIGRMEMLFLSTADAQGACDSSLRAGPPGFLRVLDDRHVAYPEYRGNGVHASLANISENPHVGLLMLDFERDLIGLHVNGRARIVDDEIMRALHPTLSDDPARGRRAERWVVVEVAEAYIHCRKHIPRMARVHEARAWGTDDPARKGGDYFEARGTGPVGAGGIDGADGVAAAEVAHNSADVAAGTIGAHVLPRPTVSPESAPARPMSAESAESAIEPPAHPAAAPADAVGPADAVDPADAVAPAVAIEPVAVADPTVVEPAGETGVGPSAEPVGVFDPVDPPTSPLPIQAPAVEPARPRFPSTTHLPAGAATARPLRTATRTGWPPHAARPRRIRWLSS